MPRMTDDTIRGLRASLAPDCAGLPVSHLRSILDSTVSALPDSTTEDFLSTLGSVGKAVAPALQQAAPSVAQGAATGATFGPYGALIGAGAGLVSSLIQGQRKPAAAPPASASPVAAPATSVTPTRAAAVAPPPAASAPVAPPPSQTPAASAAPAQVPNTAGGAPPVAAAPAAPAAPIPQLPSGKGAAATLLSLVQNPTVLTALLSQALGPQGNPDIATPSGASVPRGAINGLLTQLLSNASNELPEAESVSEQRYLQDAAGEYLVDPAAPDQLGALVLFHVQPRESIASRKSSNADLFQWLDAGDSAESVAFF
jgi:hypothetical protein